MKKKKTPTTGRNWMILMFRMQVGISLQSGLRTRHAQTRYYKGTGQAIRHTNFPVRLVLAPPPLGVAPHGWRNSGFRQVTTLTTTSTSQIYTYIYTSVQLSVDQIARNPTLSMLVQSPINHQFTHLSHSTVLVDEKICGQIEPILFRPSFSFTG